MQTARCLDRAQPSRAADFVTSLTAILVKLIAAARPYGLRQNWAAVAVKEQCSEKNVSLPIDDACIA
jgi:hypothetical protein